MKKSTNNNYDVFVHKEIIEKCKQGNPSAQYKLYKLYSKAMFNVCFRMMNNRADAEDMLQDAFVDAFSNLDSFRYESSFGTWMKRNVINKCLNEINRKKPELVYCDDMSYFQKDKVCTEDYSQALSKGNVQKAMEALPNGTKLVFSLYLLEGYDHQEIAQILNFSVSNSKTQLMRAKKRVKETLMAMKGNEEYMQMRQPAHSHRTSYIPSSFNRSHCLQAQ